MFDIRESENWPEKSGEKEKLWRMTSGTNVIICMCVRAASSTTGGRHVYSMHDCSLPTWQYWSMDGESLVSHDTYARFDMRALASARYASAGTEKDGITWRWPSMTFSRMIKWEKLNETMSFIAKDEDILSRNSIIIIYEHLYVISLVLSANYCYI